MCCAVLCALCLHVPFVGWISRSANIILFQLTLIHSWLTLMHHILSSTSSTTLVHFGILKAIHSHAVDTTGVLELGIDLIYICTFFL